jgi:phospholipid/cholesterol/gamma-HCH transport system substrate-binding protein
MTKTKTSANSVTRGHVLWFIITVGGSVALCIWLMVINNQLSTPGSRYTVRAVLPTAASLAPDSRVTIAGVKVGQVTSIKRVGRGAEVDLQIDDERVTPIPVDSRVTLRMRTPLSENYINITRGSARQNLPSGSTVPAAQTDDYVDVDQILSMLQGTTRQRVRAMLQSTGEALDGRGAQLNRLVGGAASTVTYGSHFMKIAARNRESVRRTVRQLGSVMAAVGEREAAIHEVGHEGLKAMRAVAARDRALRSMLVALPPTLADIRTTMNTVGGVSRTATPVVVNLSAALRDLRPAITNLHPAATRLRGVVLKLGAASPGLTRTLRAVRKLAPPAGRALPQLTKTFCELDPVIRYARPYTDDVIQTIVGLGSGSNAYDALGHTLRMAPTINDSSLVGAPPEINRAAYLLVHSGLFAKTRGALTWDPYPPPGRVGSSTASGRKNIIGPSEVPSTGYKYPRIHADC